MNKNESVYMVSVTYGRRTMTYGPESKEEAQSRFKALRPAIGRTGPRPVVRLFRQVKERKVIRKDTED